MISAAPGVAVNVAITYGVCGVCGFSRTRTLAKSLKLIRMRSRVAVVALASSVMKMHGAWRNVNVTDVDQLHWRINKPLSPHASDARKVAAKVNRVALWRFWCGRYRQLDFFALVF